MNSMCVADIAFYLFAFGLVSSCILLLFAQRIFYGALSLLLIVFHMAALLILMGAEFIGLALLISYTAALSIYFFFTVLTGDVCEKESVKLTLIAKSILYALIALLGGQLCFLLLSKVEIASKGFLQDQTNEVLKVQSLGEVLYTDYFFIFQLTGFLLFVAMICVLALLGKSSDHLLKRKIGIFKALSAYRVTMKSMPVGKGVKED